MSRQRLGAIFRRVERIAAREEISSLLVDRLSKKPALSPAEARLYRRMTGADR